MKSTFIEFKKDQYLLKEEESHIINCYFELKDNEKDSLFTSYGDERFIVKLDGYAIIPIEKYTKLNRPFNFLYTFFHAVKIRMIKISKTT